MSLTNKIQPCIYRNSSISMDSGSSPSPGDAISCCLKKVPHEQQYCYISASHLSYFTSLNTTLRSTNKTATMASFLPRAAPRAFTATFRAATRPQTFLRRPVSPLLRRYLATPTASEQPRLRLGSQGTSSRKHTRELPDEYIRKLKG